MRTLHVDGAMLSDIGRVRAVNEDSVACLLPPPDSGRPAVAILADGMGGHAAGEVASRLAVETLSRLLPVTGTPIDRRLANAFAVANAAIRAHAIAHPGTAGMGTTCTALVIDGDGAWLGHVGDSRAYHMRYHAITQISEDHSLVGDLLRRGIIDAAAAAAHPHRNIILRAMGTEARIDPHIAPTPLALLGGDVLVLCSDGLSDLVDARQIGQAADTLSPEMACRTLVDLALAAGGHDNVSVGVFRLHAR